MKHFLKRKKEQQKFVFQVVFVLAENKKSKQMYCSETQLNHVK